MSHFSLDVEADNQTPWNGSMVCFGVVRMSDLTKTFYGQTAPITDQYDPDALSISGFSREEHLLFPDPLITMEKFYNWVIENNKDGRPIIISDNPSFDFAWLNYYFHRYIGENPFGWSAKRIGDIYSGLVGNTFKANHWKKFRKTKHTHNPVDDALGNAQAVIKMKEKYDLIMKL